MGINRIVGTDGAIAAVDAAGTEHAAGHVVVEDDVIVAVGAGPAPAQADDVPTTRIDASGCLVTPGLVNCHHHLYQWATRGRAQQATLFEWLVKLYPVWARIDERVERACARAGLATLLRSGCTTASDHHYVFPAEGGDLLAVEVEAARELGIRFNPCRGAMDLGEAPGGPPPGSVCEERAALLAAYADALCRFPAPARGARCGIALAPCARFSGTQELMAQTAELGRARGVRLH